MRFKPNHRRIFALFKRILIVLSIIFLIYWIRGYLFADQYDPNYDPHLSDERRIAIYDRMIQVFRSRERANRTGDSTRYYRKRPETEHVDCGRVLAGDKSYTQSLTGFHRTPLIPDPQLDMSCHAVRRRLHPYPSALKPLKVGVAFARIVYMDYEFIEKQIAASFHPQNLFCFVVDRKADADFREKMKTMAACFDNIVLVPVLYDFDSAGHNHNLGHYKCMEQVLREPGWNYLFLLQNHDVVTKTVYELARVYELLGGANDVEVTHEVGRLDKRLRWDPRWLKLFRNESAYDSALLDTSMKFAKGDSEGSMSREAVDWLVNTVDLSIFIDQWNQTGYGCDEQFLASFQVNSAFGMPGHFTDECLLKGISTDHASKMRQWVHLSENRTSWRRCSAKTIRHSVCLMGIEDLRTLAAYPNLMVNKMMPSFDYSIVECTAELLHNRTFLGQTDHPLDEEYYSSLVHVIYHKHHREPGFQLQCTPNRTQWTQLPYPV